MPAAWGAEPGLARLVPADARLYLEVRDWNGLTGSPLGALLSDMLRSLAPPATQPAASRPTTTQAQGTQPASAPAPLTWRDRLASHLGVPGPHMLDQLSSGRLVLVADGWDEIGQAILIAQPAKPVELEPLLRALPPAPAVGHLRCSKLSNDHELAFDGAHVVIGRRFGPNSLFSRTLSLWLSPHGAALCDMADFRDRIRLLPDRSQVLLYLTGRTRAGQGAALPAILWPAVWNQFQSLAATVSVSTGGITIETTAEPGRAVGLTESSGRSLLTELPASTLLAWTQAIDYAAHYRRLGALTGQRTFAFYRGVLENGLPRGSLDTHFLSHLAEETLFVLSQIARPVATSPGDPYQPLWIPALTVAVQTASQEVVTTTVDRAFQNLLMLLNVQPAQGGPLSIENVPIGPGGGTVHSISVGRLLRQKPGGEILGQLQLSWTVAENLVVVGTATEAVRDLVLARRRQAPLLAQLAVGPRGDRPAARTVLIAQPTLISDLLASWAQSFSANPSLLAQSDWWTQLQSVRAVSLYQLGAVPGRVAAGAVQIAFVIPQLPAASKLRAGDTVVAVEGQPLDASDALASLEWLLATRPRAEAVQFKVIRDDCEELIELPVAPPPAPPRPIGAVEFLQQASRVLQLFAGARYSTSSPEPGALVARLELTFAPATAAR